MPPHNLVQNALDALIEHHRSRGLSNQVPVFTWDTEEIACFMHEEGLCDDYTGAYDAIEQVTADRKLFYFEDWEIEHDYVRDLWVFRRKLDFSDIVKDSSSRKEIVEEHIRTKIADLDPRAFETLLINMFDRIPHVDDPFVRKQSHDGGFEMSLRITDPITGAAEWILVQAKQQSKKVSVSQVRELLGTISIESNKHRNRRYRGLMISTLPATTYAVQAAKDSGSLVDFIALDGLVKLMMENNIGWQKEALEFATISESFWTELEDE